MYTCKRIMTGRTWRRIFSVLYLEDILGRMPEKQYTRRIYTSYTCRRIYSLVYQEKIVLLEKSILGRITGEEYTRSDNWRRIF